MINLDIISTPLIKAKIHGTTRECKVLDLTEKWFNVSKKGFGYYFILDNVFVSVDGKTANGRWIADTLSIDLGGNKKVTCKGYLYINNRGYLAYAVKNISNIKVLAATKPKDVAPSKGANARNYSKEEYDAMVTNIDDFEP